MSAERVLLNMAIKLLIMILHWYGFSIATEALNHELCSSEARWKICFFTNCMDSCVHGNKVESQHDVNKNPWWSPYASLFCCFIHVWNCVKSEGLVRPAHEHAVEGLVPGMCVFHDVSNFHVYDTSKLWIAIVPLMFDWFWLTSVKVPWTEPWMRIDEFIQGNHWVVEILDISHTTFLVQPLLLLRLH